jgi:cell wall-associated NlpC family hydrolase
MMILESKRICLIAAVLAAASLCVIAALVATSTAHASANANETSPAAQPYVSDYQARDWCDDWNDVWWDDCDEDWGDDDGDGSDDTPPPAPTEPVAPEPTAPVGPTEPVEPPVTQWPKPPKGAVAKLRANGRTAKAPNAAPPPVKKMIKAANSLTRKPYKWGGGHGKWIDRGYDCSGSVSYVLHAAGILDWPMVSGGLAKWGIKGAGRWVQIYANSGHVFMVIAGLRFDTSGAGESGPRWREEGRFTKGFKLRHPAGL